MPSPSTSSSVSKHASKSKPLKGESSTQHSTETVSPFKSPHGESEDGEEDGFYRFQLQDQNSNEPAQKRRRVTRACDECRQKKIKCDGKQPCSHCFVYSYKCTYIKPSNRRRNPTPQYIEALESQLQRAESLLRKYIPDVDLADPALDPAVQQEIRARQLARKQTGKARVTYEKERSSTDKSIASIAGPMGDLNLNSYGTWEFYGSSSSTVFFLWIRDHFHGMLGLEHEEVDFHCRPNYSPKLAKPVVPNHGCELGEQPSMLIKAYGLPLKETARSLCYYYTLNSTSHLIRILHIPSLYELLDQIYDSPPGDDANIVQRHNLALIHSVFALGYTYQTMDAAFAMDSRYRDYKTEGLKHYEISQHLLQQTSGYCNLKSLQTLLHMILFLQGSSDLTQGYVLIGMALRMCIRMGLHRNLHHSDMSCIEIEERRRAFFVVRHLDINVSHVLGFPILLHEDDVDQEPPSEVDDEFILHDQILTQPPETQSFFEASNAHARLLEIMVRVTKHVYPIKRVRKSEPSSACSRVLRISYEKVQEIEKDLQQWFEDLPMAWRPGSKGTIEVVRVQHLLRFFYAHVQLALYRPFLRYTAPRLVEDQDIDEPAFAYAAAAISVSRNIVHIGNEMQKQGVLVGPYWLLLSTELFAVLTLVFHVSENPNKQDSMEILEDAYAGWDLITKLTKHDIEAHGVCRALKLTFKCLSAHLSSKQTQAPIPSARKRSAPYFGEHDFGYLQSSKPGSQTSPKQVSRASRIAIAVEDKAVSDPPTPRANSYKPTDALPHSEPKLTTKVDRPNESDAFPALSNSITIDDLDSLAFSPEDGFKYTATPLDLDLAENMAQAEAHSRCTQSTAGSSLLNQSTYHYDYGYDYSTLNVDLDPGAASHTSLPAFMTRQIGGQIGRGEAAGAGYTGHLFDHGTAVACSVPGTTTATTAAVSTPVIGSGMGVDMNIDMGINMGVSVDMSQADAHVRESLLAGYTKAGLGAEEWSGFTGVFGGNGNSGDGLGEEAER
ncbi:putative transcriptional regulatory protein YJL206C [Ceratocystis fimbriata CBS 114723]|uniref:Putative transcriptional regulatory protein YJL206C n=1 Tax=Ceratocystis fimbriata CBS 114723 TaxID=1035309 RepID=A0A2C5W3J5_9PEZI|nr:putative transcriptional regulatory protein YJL206C [Ceratocystis fimbriata CBS 114723]